MTKIISIHSFRGGTGKSNTLANVAALIAAQSHRVGVIDTDIQSPGIHVLFGLPGDQLKHTINDYLRGDCKIASTAVDVTANLGQPISGKVFLIPASMKPAEITRMLRQGYDVQVLTQGLRQVIDELQLDALLIDTHPGLNEETLVSFVLAHTLVILLRPDQQDYEGTGVTVQVARQLEVPNLTLVVNKVPAVFDLQEVRTKVEQTYGCPVAAVLPHSDDLMALASAGVFALRFPDHPLTGQYQALAARLMDGDSPPGGNA